MILFKLGIIEGKCLLSRIFPLRLKDRLAVYYRVLLEAVFLSTNSVVLALIPIEAGSVFKFWDYLLVGLYVLGK